MNFTATATHNSDGSTILHYRNKEQTFPKLSKAIRFAQKIGEVVDGWEPFLTDDSKIKSAKNKRRFASFFRDGMPSKVRCYTNDGETIDRYTIVFSGNYRGRLGRVLLPGNSGRVFWSLCCSSNPTHPLGVGTLAEDRQQIDYPTYGHLGTKILFKELPTEVQSLVVCYYLDIWGFTDDKGWL